jgi:tetratricopeptide (TPR) repeat protein
MAHSLLVSNQVLNMKLINLLVLLLLLCSLHAQCDDTHTITERIENRKLQSQASTGSDLAKDYLVLGYLYDQIDSSMVAIDYFLKADQVYHIIDDMNGRADVHNRIGIISYQHNDFNQAVSFYSKGLRFSSPESNKYSQLQYNIGDAYYRLAHYDLAKSHLDTAIDSYSSFSSDKMSAYLLLSNMYYDIQDYQSQIDLLLSIERAYELEDFQKAQIANNLANGYIAMSDLSKAESQLQRVAKSVDLSDHPTLAQTYHHLYAKWHLANGDTEMSINQYLLAIDSYKDYDQSQEVSDLYREAIAASEASGINQKRIIELYRLSNIYHSGLIDDRGNLNHYLVAITFRHQNKIRWMDKIRKEEERERMILILLLSGSSIILLLLAFLGYRYYIQYNREKVLRDNAEMIVDVVRQQVKTIQLTEK